MRAAAVVFVLVLLTGCGLFRGSGDCKEPKGYQGNAELPLLRVPEGMEPPNQRALLRIPEVKGSVTRRADGRCLDEPPPFEVKSAPRAAATVRPAGEASVPPVGEARPVPPAAAPE